MKKMSLNLMLLVLAGFSLVEKTFAFSEAEVACVARAMHGEDNRPGAGWNSIGGTIMSRYYSGKYPKNLCSIVNQVWKGKRQFSPKSLATLPINLHQPIMNAARAATTRRGNGYLGFRSYCKKGGRRIAGQGGNCFTRSADSSLDDKSTPRTQMASEVINEVLPNDVGADAAI